MRIEAGELAAGAEAAVPLPVQRERCGLADPGEQRRGRGLPPPLHLQCAQADEDRMRAEGRRAADGMVQAIVRLHEASKTTSQKRRSTLPLITSSR